MASFSQNQVPIFTGENYDFWSIKFKTVLRAHDLWEVVENGVPEITASTNSAGDKAEPPSTSESSSSSETFLKEWQKKDADALAKIHQAISDSIFPRIMNCTSAKQAWETLKDEFLGTIRIREVKLQTFRRDFENLHMKNGESIKDFSSRVNEVVNQLRAYGDDIKDQRVVQKLLISLTEKFDSIVGVVEQSKDLAQLSVNEVVGSLQAHEQRISRRAENFNEGAFQIKHKNQARKSQKQSGGEKRGKFPPCGICKKTNHPERDCWQKGKPQCRNCKKFGHTDQTCRLKQNQQAGVSEATEGKNHLFYACQSATAKKDDVWLIDSGCTNHMAKNEAFFTDLNSTIKVPVRMGDGGLVESGGKGTVAIQTSKGTKFIKDVLYVPELDQNLLSVPQMMINGYSLLFEGNTCAIYDQKRKEIAKVQMENKSFPIQWKYATEKSLASQAGADSSLWHKRFGHCSIQNLKLLSQKEMVKDLPAITDLNGVCEGCQLGKMHRQPFPTGKAWRASQKLQLIHTDVCGPMRTPSLDNSRYFILFINDYTRMTWVYFF